MWGLWNPGLRLQAQAALFFPEHFPGAWLLTSSLVLAWPWLVWVPSVACGLLGSAWYAEGAKKEGSKGRGPEDGVVSQHADPEPARALLCLLGPPVRPSPAKAILQTVVG